METQSALGNLNFVLPTLDSTQMTKDQQGAILVNQATTMIISAWLAHRNVAMQISSSIWAHSAIFGDILFLVEKDDLVQAINDVQDALKGF